MIDRYNDRADGLVLPPGVRTRNPERVSGENGPHRRFFLESWFTPPGTNARNAQQDQIADIMSVLQKRFHQMNPLIQRWIEGRARLMPQAMRAVQELIDAQSPGAIAARIARQGNAADENAAQSARQAALALRASGLGDGAVGGAVAGELANALREKNRYYAYEHSPERQAQSLQAILGAVGGYGALGGNDFNTAMSLGSLINNQQPVLVGAGFGEILGQLAGVASNYIPMGGGAPSKPAPYDAQNRYKSWGALTSTQDGLQMYSMDNPFDFAKPKKGFAGWGR
jgi:hypothetical protein